MTNQSGKPWADLAIVALVAANLIPLGGVFFLGWGVAEILYAYWAENVAVGLVTLIKMATSRAKREDGGFGGGKIFLMAFFSVHYGMFCFAHAFFIFGGFLFGRLLGGPSPKAAVIEYLQTHWFLVVGFVASHLVSYVLKFLRQDEAEKLTADQLMSQPYHRIFILQFTVILGGMAVMALGSSVVLIVILVIAKICGDLILHRREHRRAAEGKV